MEQIPKTNLKRPRCKNGVDFRAKRLRHLKFEHDKTRFEKENGKSVKIKRISYRENNGLNEI